MGGFDGDWRVFEFHYLKIYIICGFDGDWRVFEFQYLEIYKMGCFDQDWRVFSLDSLNIKKKNLRSYLFKLFLKKMVILFKNLS